MYIGIDPGIKGAIAVVDNDGNLECVEDSLSGAHFRKAQLKQLIDSLNLYSYTVGKIGSYCYLEKAQAFPKQGISSTFKIGYDFGQWEALLVGLSIPYRIIRPQEWQKIIGSQKPRKATKKQHKEWIASAACSRWPEQKEWFYGPQGGLKDGRADAALIAAYCRMKERG